MPLLNIKWFKKKMQFHTQPGKKQQWQQTRNAENKQKFNRAYRELKEMLDELINRRLS